MPKLPKFASFLLRFFVAYFLLVLVANLSGFRNGFTDWFAERNTNKYKDFIPQTEASFQSNTELGEHDLNIIFINNKTREEIIAEARRTGKQNVNLDISASPFSVWDYWLLPFIVLMALVVAMPGGWKRKLQSLALGLVVLYLFTLFRYRKTMWHLANDSPNLEPLGLSDFSQSFLKGLHQMQSIEFIFISTFLIWALTSLRRENVSAFLSQKT